LKEEEKRDNDGDRKQRQYKRYRLRYKSKREKKKKEYGRRGDVEGRQKIGKIGCRWEMGDVEERQ